MAVIRRFSPFSRVRLGGGLWIEKRKERLHLACCPIAASAAQEFLEEEPRSFQKPLFDLAPHAAVEVADRGLEEDLVREQRTQVGRLLASLMAADAGAILRAEHESHFLLRQA
ncbi:MAG: hypothetical protein ACYDH9_03855 [Limisphaerales bacterium]